MRNRLPDWHPALWMLQISNFITNTGFFMLIPLLSVYFTKSLGYSFALVGILFSVRILAQQGLMLFGGMLGDRFGYREMIALGSIVRATGFIMFGFVHSFSLLLLACIFAGLGGSLFGPSMSAATTALSKPEQLEQVFAWRNVIGNAGLTVGPLVGMWMTHYDFFWVCLLSGGVFLLFGVLNWIMVPPLATHEGQALSIFQNIKHIIGNRPFIFLTFWLMGYSMLYQQMYISIPVLAEKYAGRDVSGYFFTALSLLIICGQSPITNWIERRKISHFTSMSLGMLLMGSSFLLPWMYPSLWTLIFPLIGIALGSILIMPSQQSYTAKTAGADLLGSYFGFSALSAALGGTVGNSLGGWIIDVARSLKMEGLPFLIFSFIGVICSIGIWQIARKPQKSKVRKRTTSAVL